MQQQRLRGIGKGVDQFQQSLQRVEAAKTLDDLGAGRSLAVEQDQVQRLPGHTRQQFEPQGRQRAAHHARQFAPPQPQQQGDRRL